MVSVIIVAAGCSERFGSDKLVTPLGGVPLLLHTLQAFETHEKINEIILVTSNEKVTNYADFSQKFSKITNVILGGKNRQESVVRGVFAAKGNICLTHNGANPLVSQKEISEVIEALEKYDAVFVGRKCSATIRKIQKNMSVETLNREELVEVETPQGFYKNDYLAAVSRTDTVFTDEIAVLESIGIQAHFVPAASENRKITTPYDLQCAESFLSSKTRLGFGHDSHRFKENNTLSEASALHCGKDNSPRPLGEGLGERADPLAEKTYIKLAGVSIPHSKTFEANSDGDVVFHTLCNALGTAIGEGSLSLYADKMCKSGIKDSQEYLRYIFEKVKKRDYSVGNIVISIEGKEPKLEKYIPAMKKNIAKLLEITKSQIGIACTTGEELSSFGKGKGIQCFAWVQIIKSQKYKL